MKTNFCNFSSLTSGFFLIFMFPFTGISLASPSHPSNACTSIFRIISLSNDNSANGSSRNINFALKKGPENVLLSEPFTQAPHFYIIDPILVRYPVNVHFYQPNQNGVVGAHQSIMLSVNLSNEDETIGSLDNRSSNLTYVVDDSSFSYLDGELTPRNSFCVPSKSNCLTTPLQHSNSASLDQSSGSGLADYLKTLFPNATTQALETMVKYLRDDDEVLKKFEAWRLNQDLIKDLGLSEKLVELSTDGPNRFFWIKRPVINNGQPVPARVLHIHRNSSENPIILSNGKLFDDHHGYVITIEILLEPNEKSEFTSFVDTLSVDELVLDRKHTRISAEDLFLQRVSPVGSAIQALARQHQLPTYLFSSTHTAPGVSWSSEEHPLNAMNKLTHIVNFGEAMEVHGHKLAELMTPSERQAGNRANVHDIMGRLDARDIADHFVLDDIRHYRQTHYLWVLTEDGVLKISFQGTNKTIEQNPQIVRLAHGRRIYAGGVLRVSPEEGLVLFYFSHNYEIMNTNLEHPERREAFMLSSRPELNRLVDFAFFMQAGLILEKIRYVDPSNVIDRHLFSWFDDLNYLKPESFLLDRSYEAGWRNVEDVMYAIRNGAKGNSEKSENFWDPDDVDSELIELNEWRNKKNANDLVVDREWARYVLGVKITDTPLHIKLKYRKFAQRYHPDRSPSGASQNEMGLKFKIIKQAYELLAVKGL